MKKNNIANLRGIEEQNSELSWFSQMVNRGRESPFTEIVTVTPAIAARLLENNEGNRNKNECQIGLICRDITNGFWQLNGETIIVSRDGQLNDGQNRLEAVLRSGCSIQTAMMFGVSRDSRYSVDMGRQRQTSDFMKMHEVKNAANVAAIVTLYQLYKTGIYRHSVKRSKITKQEILLAYSHRKKDFDRATEVATSSKQIRSFGASSIGASYVIIHDVNPIDCDTFFDRLEDGAGLSRGSAILSLRNRLSNPLQRLQSNEKLELILRGWNAWREGRINTNAPPVTGNYPKVTI